MQLPTLRRPVAASALAGILGAGIVDGLLSARGGASGQVFLLAIGLYGAVALLAGFAAPAAAALSRAAPRFFAIRALSFRCRIRRRIFIERRLSRLPIGPQYLFASGLSSQR